MLDVQRMERIRYVCLLGASRGLVVGVKLFLGWGVGEANRRGEEDREERRTERKSDILLCWRFA